MPMKIEEPKDNGLLGRNPKVPFNISNRGYFNNLSGFFGPFKLQKVFWTTAEHQTGFAHTHNVVSFGGKLFWSISYYTHVTTFEQVSGYAELIMDTIENLQ